MKNIHKKQIITELFIIVIALFVIFILTGIVRAYNVFTASEISDHAAANDSAFWNDYQVDDRIFDYSGADSKTQWICLADRRVTGVSGYNRIMCIIDINRDEKGKYSTSIYNQDGVSNQDNDFNTKKLAYLAYAATVDPGTGLIGSRLHGPRDAFYYFYTATDLQYLIGNFSLKKNDDAYLDTAGTSGATVLAYADEYANSEVVGSSADITGGNDSNASVVVAQDPYGISYSYIGPFNMYAEGGTISGVSIQDGYNWPAVVGFSNAIGGDIQDVSGIPMNGNNFYIVTNSALTSLNPSVTINTQGTAGGGIITNPVTGEQTIGYIKARVIFIGSNRGQGTAAFRGDGEIITEMTNDSITFSARNSLGKLTIQKEGMYTGIQNYENVKTLGFKIYRLEGNTRRYMRINNVSEIRDQVTITIDGNTSYSESAENATTIFTSANGTVTLDNISVEHSYYIEEINTDATNYQTKIISATIQYGYNGESNLNVSNNIAGPITVQLKGENSVITKVKLIDYRKTGNLSIEKVDQDNLDTKLGNVEFKIRNKDTNRYVIANRISSGSYTITDPSNAYTTNEANGTTFVTNTTGKIDVNGLDIGNYEIIEKKNPNYGYTVLANNVSVSISNGQTSSATIKNRKQTGNMRIHKIDADNNQYALPGVSFKIKDSQGRYIIAVDTSGATQTKVTGTIHLGNIQTTTDTNKATQFITDSSGNIRIYNLLVGTYSVSEVSIGDNFGYVVADANITWVSNLGNGSRNTAQIRVDRQISNNTGSSAGQTDNLFNTLTMKNKREYIKIKGYAWEDRTDGKNSTKDSVWKDGTADKRLQYVTVRLKKSNGQVIAETTTDQNGEYIFGNYDENKNAVKIKIDDLVGAYVEFEYNGMSYQSIGINSNFDKTEGTNSLGNKIVSYSSNTNKATDEALRDEFNNDFSTISKGKASNGNYNIRYNYDSKNHQSKVVYGNNVKYGYQGQTYPIAGVDEQYEIQAVTQKRSSNVLCTDLTPSTIRKNSVEEIGGLNLGVEERTMPDLFVLEDMQEVQISLNGYTHTYQYAQRFEDPENYAGGDPFNVSVRFANKYLENSYSRDVYSSDIVYNQNNSDSLQIFVTYIVKITNESSVYTRLNSLANYYDERYENVVVKDDRGNTLTTSQDGYNQNGLKRVNIQTNNYLIEPGKTKDLYITYQLNNEAINSILNEQLTLDSVTEVASYSSYSDANGTTPYAGIDVDSAPDTIQPKNVDGRINITDTIEDDTDKAPSLILNVKEGRMVAGTVWEDSAREDLLEDTDIGYDRERKGDGIYDEANENVIQDAKVELLTVTDSGYELAKLYKRDGSVVDASMMTTGQGDYEFSGVIPANYVLRYTYGDNDGTISVICDKDGNPVLDEDGNVKKIDADNYKSTIYRGGNEANMDAYWYRGETSNTGTSRLSDARDTIGVKKDGTIIDNIVEYRTTQDEEYNYETVNAGILKAISSDTAQFEIKLDYDVNLDNTSGYGADLRFNFDNIDLGIIERPKQVLEIGKQIANLQIVLPNGNDLINGDPRTETLQGVRVLDDDVYIEIDNEIIQGSTLRITYEISADNTKCEIDYNDEDYYIYGKVPANKESAYKIAQIVDMYDYLPEDLIFQTVDGGNWQKIDIKAGESEIKGKILADKVYEAVKENQNVVHLANQVFANMDPGSVVTDTSLVVSKQLSTSTDDLTYENDVEVVKIKGRKTYGSIPGNYDPTTNESYDPGTDTYVEDESDDDEVEVTITPPTGENKVYWIYGVVGAVMLIVIGLGVVIIKKKVLKK